MSTRPPEQEQTATPGPAPAATEAVEPEPAPSRPTRLFAAIVPPPEALASVELAVARARQDAGDAVRWTAREQWHLTLVFMGAVPEARVPAVVDELRRVAASTRPLELRFVGAGAFPRARGARVLWAGVDGQTRRLVALAETMRAATAAVDAEPAAGRFRPHLTLARVHGRLDARQLIEQLTPSPGTPWVAREIVLFRSRLGAGDGGRARHEVVAHLPLSGV